MEKIEFNWNYQIPEPTSIYANQVDWNHTILTKFNQICESKRPIFIPVRLVVPNKFRNIIESLIYYDKETQIIKINYVYLIEYINDDIEFIKVNGIKLNISNY